MVAKTSSYLKFMLVFHVAILNIRAEMELECDSVLYIYKFGEDVPRSLQEIVSKFNVNENHQRGFIIIPYR